jgi:lysophospholipase L1-like esterase
MSIYWDEFALKNSSATPSILAVGDSWFWYPFPGGSLINNIATHTAGKGHVILAKGMNGAEAFDYVHGVYERSVTTALKLYGSGLTAVLISGGGNDFAGFNDLRPLLKNDCSSATNAAGCFLSGSNGLKRFVEEVEASYRTLIGRIYTYTSVNCVVLMHTYDYAVPNGRAVFNGGEAWLKPALNAAKVPPALQQACINYLIDTLHSLLARIARSDPSHLIVVDSRGALASKNWANELHPTAAGFRRIADRAWLPVLRAQGLA